ncbi:flagellar hook capping FlgD N-terminal domain-containing protein [Luxibacter massiliensis]|uniref:flagellar hook capping FlgD N-terminal domain-containing protein n=1 Tax=Luxibacter massiliensis TaxID=2219695 RepID=UPI000F04EA84|nr:flagellar hook capping FlgD N-terminal domain-containing protein [Luxibacter massiliensis]
MAGVSEVDGFGKSQVYNDLLSTQTSAVADNSTMTMDDFWQLLAAQLQYQDMTNPMSNSEMMSQMTQMATMNTMNSVSNAISNFAVVTNNLSQVTLTSYSTSLLGREVTVATLDNNGEVIGEKKGVITGIDLTGSQSVYIDGAKYSLSQIMSVGEIPKKEDETDKEDGGTGEGEDKVPEEDPT